MWLATEVFYQGLLCVSGHTQEPVYCFDRVGDSLFVNANSLTGIPVIY
jgi:Icc-related predicted phosphoesterase